MFCKNFSCATLCSLIFCDFFGNVPVIVHMNTIILAKKNWPVKRVNKFCVKADLSAFAEMKPFPAIKKPRNEPLFPCTKLTEIAIKRKF